MKITYDLRVKSIKLLTVGVSNTWGFTSPAQPGQGVAFCESEPLCSLDIFACMLIDHLQQQINIFYDLGSHCCCRFVHLPCTLHLVFGVPLEYASNIAILLSVLPSSRSTISRGATVVGSSGKQWLEGGKKLARCASD